MGEIWTALTFSNLGHNLVASDSDVTVKIVSEMSEIN